MKADLIRKKFLDYFRSKKHKIVESDSLVPKDDPTVLFTPAGMNQFKRQFLGLITDFTRAATSQRCLRTDDLDKVGKTSVHHTFFEMLGNFSFGDYFKEEAIGFAWEFLTEEIQIKKDKFWVSVYKDDDEAYKIWKDKIKIPAHKIVKLGDKENFWPSEAKEKGPNGPCGPCSEIFFDYGEDVGCGRPDCNPACNCGRFVEAWNLVFTQFNRKADGTLEPLPRKNIDTGMGLERLTAVMQGVHSNFETDLFQPLIKEIIREIKSDAKKNTELIYAIADHIRAIVFAIYDGVLPSNETRGYVARKLIRKSTLHLRTLGIKKAFLYKLVPVVSESMRVPYPDLEERRENIAEIILAEEKSFITVLDSSETLFKEKFNRLFKHHDPEAAGVIAFELYDTHGIPLELTKGWLDKHVIKISEQAFNKELEKQKIRAKSQSTMKGDVFDMKDLHLGAKETKFLGYENFKVSAKILMIIKDNTEVKKASKDEEVKIVLDKTVFYAEAGGQVGDTGTLTKGKNVFEVLDTKKADKVITHIGKIKEGAFKKSDAVVAAIDAQRRLSTARNHTATHLLQGALRKVLGVHVKQQGSLVAPDRLRFDFTHFKDISKEQLARIEETVNNYIISNYSLSAKQMPLSAAKKSGALAFFAEKYADKVRVVSISDFSKEFCGGTHLDYTGGIGIFEIVQEGSVASGVRRIEAVTGAYAYKLIKEKENINADVAALLNIPYQRIIPELNKRLTYERNLEKKLNSQKSNIIQESAPKLLEKAEKINNINVIAQLTDYKDMDSLRKSVDILKQNLQKAVIALGAQDAGRALLVIGITPDLLEKGIDASGLIRDVAQFIGGSGGGRKDFAQAGGSKPENLAEAFKKLKEIISKVA